MSLYEKFENKDAATAKDEEKKDEKTDEKKDDKDKKDDKKDEKPMPGTPGEPKKRVRRRVG